MEWVSANDLRAPGLRLFCLPHAGSGAAGFYRWKRLLPASIAVCPVQLPGRERRMAEAPYGSATAIAAALLAATRAALGEPYAVFGHSMGALLLFEFARQIAAESLPAPVFLFASGRNAPQLAPPHRGLHLLEDDAFLAALRARFGGSQEEVLADPELRALFLPILRADLQVVETYEFGGDKLKCPVAAFAGENDVSVTDVGLAAWEGVTSATASHQRLPGDHYYHFGAGQALLLEAIAHKLEA
jgi:surfactin synthase thioesterase subunit